jgi:hypothetical protein
MFVSFDAKCECYGDDSKGKREWGISKKGDGNGGEGSGWGGVMSSVTVGGATKSRLASAHNTFMCVTWRMLSRSLTSSGHCLTIIYSRHLPLV